MCRMLLYREVTLRDAIKVSGRGSKERMEDFKEMVGAFDVGCYGLNNVLEIRNMLSCGDETMGQLGSLVLWILEILQRVGYLGVM